MVRQAIPAGWLKWFWRALLLAAVAAIAWLYGIALSAPAVATFHDDGIYLVTARALAEGAGYRITSLPEAPPQTKYPIFYPWLLSLVWRFSPAFPDNVPYLKAVSLSATALWLSITWQWLRLSGAGRLVAAVIVALTVVSPWVVYLATSTLSEPVFAALLMGTVLTLTRVEQSALPAWKPCLAAGALAGACALTRSAGVVVVGAGLAWLAVRRQWAGLFTFSVTSGAALIPWAIWVVGAPAEATDGYYSASIYAAWNVLLGYEWPQKLTVTLINALAMAASPISIWGLPTSPGIVVLVALAGAAGVTVGLWRLRRQPATAVVVALLGLHLLWVWPPTRFIVPLVPLLLWAVWQCRPRRVEFAVLLALCLGVTSTWRSSEIVRAALETGTMWPMAEGAEDWRRLHPLLDWLRVQTAPDAIVTGNLDPLYYLYSDRRAVRAFSADPYALYYASGAAAERPLGTVDDFKTRLLSAKVDFCVWTPGPGFGESRHYRRLLDDLSGRYPGSLTVAAGEPAGDYVVYQVNRSVLERLTD
jgi:hypothetical protein